MMTTRSPAGVVDNSSGAAVDEYDPSVRCGLSSKSFQIRPIVERDSPDLLAIDARDQWVALAGFNSNVATTTSSTRSSVIETGRPGLVRQPHFVT
jgi:hypothetical protein